MVDRIENFRVSSIWVYLVILLLKDHLVWRLIIITWVLSEGLSILGWKASRIMLRNMWRDIPVNLADLLGILLSLVKIYRLANSVSIVKCLALWLYRRQGWV
jgi:hypothetical protein